MGCCPDCVWSRLLRGRVPCIISYERVRVMDCICYDAGHAFHSCAGNVGRRFDTSVTRAEALQENAERRNRDDYHAGRLPFRAAWHEGHREDWWREVVGARVRVGALYCDNNEQSFEGYAWFWRIQLGTLDLGECEECVMGQLYGSYVSSPMFDHALAGEMGFDTFGTTNWDRAIHTVGRPEYFYNRPGLFEEYALLTWAWAREIRARRAAERIVPDGFTESLGF